MAVENNVFRVWIELYLVFVRGATKLPCFLSGDRSWLDLGVGDKINLFFVYGCEVDLNSVEGWNLFGCCVGCRNILDFCMRADNCFECEQGNWRDIECGDRNCLNFSLWMKLIGFELVFWVVEIYFISVRGIGIDLLLRGGGKWHVFSVWIELNSFFCPGIEIDLILQQGSKLTSFLCGG